MTPPAPGLNPDLRCARRRPPCAHKLGEHGDGECFGVVMVAGVPADCGCGGFKPPDERAAAPREGA